MTWPLLGSVSSDLRCMLGKGGRQTINLFGIHDLISTLEKPCDGGFMNLHFGVANADRAIADDTLALRRLVRNVDPFDAERWNGIQIDGHAQFRARSPSGTRE